MSTLDIRLDYKPRGWQREVHAMGKRFSVLAVHRRAGKSELGIMRLIDAASRCQEELGLFIYLAPFLKQCKTVVWARLKQKLEPLRVAGAIEVREGDLAVVFKHNGATIRLFGADNHDALRGVRLDGCLLDEVSQVKPEVWNEVIQPALSDRLGWAVFIGTPNGTNLFSELFAQAAQKQSNPDSEWGARRFTADDTDALDAGEVSRLREEMSPEAYAREFLCDFAASGQDQLLSLTEVEEATKRNYSAPDISHAPVVLGVDPARFGDDRSVIVRRQGLAMFEPIALLGVDNMELANRVAAEIDRHRPAAVFCDSGAGAGVIDRLRSLGHRVVEVPFGGRANNPKAFANRRCEMWSLMAEWIRGAGQIPDDLSLKAELAAPTYTYDAQGRQVLESKDAIKRRLGGASPDLADALALTFAAPVAAPRRRPKSKRGGNDWVPWER